jgi:hypothetical protein
MKSRAPFRFSVSLFTVFLSLGVASAANHYVRAGASGTGSGLDWANACADFSGSCAIGSLTRGDTYYVAAGTYAGHSWNRATSGTLVITIKRATIGDHGTDTGWNAAYDGQVNWGYSQNVSTGYWMFDGASASDPTDLNTYGFKLLNPASCSSDQIPSNVSGNNVTWKYTGASLCGASFNNVQYCWEISGDNATLSHVYCNNANALVQENGGVSNNLFEYAYVYNHWSSAQHHGEVWQLVCANCTIRYNYVDNCEGTACISGNASTAPGAPNLIPIYNCSIYGNVFNNNHGGNGVLGMAGSTGIASTKFYNNTIANQTTGSNFYECNSPCPAGAGNNSIRNNIVWNSRCGSTLRASGDTIDYNSYLSCTTSAPSESNSQVSPSNPFADARGDNFQLATDTMPWVSLPSPYNADMTGTARTSSRGAFQFHSQSAQQPPSPPQNLSVTVQ